MPNRPRTPRPWLPALTIAVVFAAPAAAVAAAHATLVVAKDGLGSPKDCDAAIPTPYTTIGAAVAAARAGDLVKVCPGIYAEQVVIAKSLTLQGENGAVMRPSAMQANTTSLVTGSDLAVAIVVDGAKDVAIEGLTVDGADNGLNCTPSLFGIFFRNASGAIRNSVIENMRPELAACASSGTGIFVQSAGGSTSKVRIEGNSIHDYQKNGITANEAGTDVRIGKGNVITGLGSTAESVQNGIQLAFGATGVIEDSIVTNNISAACASVSVCPFNANAVIIFQSGGVRVSDNVLGLSQTGVFVEGDDNTVTQNRIFDMQVFDGVAVFGDHNRIHQNTIVRSDESAIFIDGNHNKVQGNRINEAPVGILKSGTGNVFAGNRFFNTPTPDPVAGPAGSRASPQR